MNNDNEHQAKPVVQTLNAGLAAPIPINTQDAINLAKQQNEYQENLEALENNGTLPANQKPNDHIAQAIAVGSNEAQALDAKAFHQTNDIVKVVEVKTSKKTYALLILAIIAIAAVIVIELKHYVF